MSTALVLGAGGVAGIAWETGLLAGLAAAECDLVGSADMLLGTSAGSTVAAQVASATPLQALYQAQLHGTGADEPRRDVDLIALSTEVATTMQAAPDPTIGRRHVGAIAREADRVPESTRRALIASRLPEHRWPDRPLTVIAVSTTTGEVACFDHDSGVDLVDAVAASCAIPRVWRAVTIGDDRYMDGGTRSPTNADLVLDHDTIVVLDAYGAEAPELDGCAARVVVVSPDHAARAAMADLLDPAARASAARAGYAQAGAETDRLTALIVERRSGADG